MYKFFGAVIMAAIIAYVGGFSEVFGRDHAQQILDKRNEEGDDAE
jgi:hypothetical protein